jgi:long chain fatty acid CoA FadD26
LIIRPGTNLHPEGIEATIGASDNAFGLAGAAFAIEANEEEQVVVALAPGKPLTEAMIEQALKADAQEHRMRLFDLVLLRAGMLPRTTSGKVRRAECRKLYLSGDLARGAYHARILPGAAAREVLATLSVTAVSNSR